MPLEAGQNLCHYRLIEKIGEGGMGVVWRALDTTLGRDVAVKILPDIFSGDARQLARFEREAQLLASLNHTNIAGIYGLHEADGMHFLAMEHVPGQDLRQRLEHGPLPVAEALSVAARIAEALETAHQRGVIHRDLKPANIRVTPDGKIKVLDFGLAKIDQSPGSSHAADASPTVITVNTQSGVLLGTAAYMSPEQARGRPLDKRTDIWAFGCVVYELLTAHLAFEGETISDTMVRVLSGEPDWEALPQETPPAVHRLLHRCLQKDAARRLHHIGDALIEIEDAIGEESGEESGAVPAEVTAPIAPKRPVRRWRLPILALAAIVLAGVAFVVGFSARRITPAPPPTSRSVIRFTVSEPMPFWRASPEDYPSLAVSPDGTKLVYVSLGEVDGKPATPLFLREIDRLESVSLRATVSANGAFFSPDGEWLAYFASGKLWKASLQGGPRLELAYAPMPRGGSWGHDGWIIYSPIPEEGLMRVRASGGAPESLSVPDKSKGERAHRWPHVLPNGKAVLLTVGLNDITSFDEARIDVLSLETGERRPLIEGGTYPLYAPTGHLLYITKGSLFAVPFDPEGLRITGDRIPVLEDIVTHPSAGSAQLALSEAGTLAYLKGGPKRLSAMVYWLAKDGTMSPILDRQDAYTAADISADGRFLAVSVDAANTQIYTHDLDRGSGSRLTFEWSTSSPLWTPDGRHVAFASDQLGQGNVFLKKADGQGAVQPLTDGDLKKWPTSWSPDGRTLAFVRQSADTLGDIWLMDTDGKSEPRPFTATPFAEGAARFSPDGKWLAYNSSESGRAEVYVKPVAGPEVHRHLVSVEGGMRPFWSPRGDEIYYQLSGKLMAVSVSTEPEFAAAQVRIVTEFAGVLWGIHPDGERFLVVKEDPKHDQAPIHVVVNWFEELQQRLGPGSGG